MNAFSKLLIVLCGLAAAALAVSTPISAAAPPPPVPLPLPVPIVPNTAQEPMQTQLAIEQAQAQARVAASQAKVQSMLDANQAKLEGQVAAGQQALLSPSAQLAALPPPVVWPYAEGLAAPIGKMQLTTLTPQLGRYFGTDRGVLVLRAPAHGPLKLQGGDVILSIGGRTPASRSQAIRILASYDPGDSIELIVLREHHKVDIRITLPKSTSP